MTETPKNKNERRIFGLTILQFMSLMALAGIALTLIVNHFSH